MAMDVKRDPAILRKKNIRRTIIWSFVGILVITVSAAVMKLKPAAPSVAYNTLWFGTVKRGPMVREVRGAGTLVPEDIRWITATTSGRVSKIVLRPGAQVKEGTIILEMSNPDLEMSVANAKVSHKSAEAQLAKAMSDLEQTINTQANAVATAKSNHDLQQATLTADKTLREQGIVSPLQVQRDQASFDQAKLQWEMAQKTLETTQKNK